MNRNYEPVSRQASGGPGMRSLLILLIVAFIGGAILSGWLITRYDLLSSEAADSAQDAAATPQDEAAAALERRINDDGTVAPPQEVATPAPLLSPSANTVSAATLDARIGELEERLSRINMQANAASGNVTRAEALLVAFAARRALDRGSSLGILEGQLQVRFGEDWPNAVAAIIAAGREPVTMDQLRTGLDDLTPTLTSAADLGFWASAQRELSELFVVRREGTVSTSPEQRLERAHRFLEAGRVEPALAEVRRLPGSDAAGPWIDLADRYIDARRALDLIETAAILEPRAIRSDQGEPAVPDAEDDSAN